MSAIAKNIWNYMSNLSNLSNIFTIIGVFFAVKVYYSWRRDYRYQQAHIYSLSLLKKMKKLHAEVESMRCPKFYDKKTIIDDLDKKYIPQIEAKILTSVTEIAVDLLVAKNILIYGADLQSTFNNTVFKNVIRHINIAVNEFYLSKPRSFNELQSLSIWQIIFPAEIKVSKLKFAKSNLGIGGDVIDDDFNGVVESSFGEIYSVLEKNIDIVKPGFMQRMKCLISLGCNCK